MGKTMEAIVSIFAGITVVAIVAVLVSKNSNTAGVTTSFFGGYSGALSAALAPVTGGMQNNAFQFGGAGVTNSIGGLN